MTQPNSHAPLQPVPSRPPRWPRLLTLALFCFAGGATGWLKTVPLYRSEGLIQRVTPPAVFDEAQSRIEPPLAADLLVLGSTRVAEDAIRSPDWVKIGRGITPAAATAFRKSLSVAAAPGGIFKVHFHDPDPKIAQIGATAVTSAFENLHLGRSQSENMRRLRLLQDRRVLLLSQIAKLDARILEEANESGAPDPSLVHAFKTQEWLRLERDVRAAEAPTSGAASTTQASTRPAPKWLVERLERTRNEAMRAGWANLRIQDLDRQRQDAHRDRIEVEKRINRLQLESGMGSGLSVLSYGDLPATPAIDHRPRNAAVGALVGLVGYLFTHAILRAVVRRRRYVNPRTAFPVITHHEPRPVVPIDPVPQPPAAG